MNTSRAVARRFAAGAALAARLGVRPVTAVQAALTVVLVTTAALAASPADGTSRSGPENGGPEALEMVAFCAIPPLQYVVERVSGDLAEVHVLVGPGQSPHTFEPTPRQMAELAGADVYFSVGMPFEEKLLHQVRELCPDLVVADTGESVPRRSIEQDHDHSALGDEHRETHREHGGGDGERGGADREHGGLPDPHFWLAPGNAALQAEVVHDVLKALVPGEWETLDANLASLVRDLSELDAELAEALAPLHGERIYVFHPAFGYFTDAYGLEQVPIELGGVEPSARELAALIEQARGDGVRVVFVQPQFASRTASAIAKEIGGAVVPIDPLSGDYIENLRNIAREVQKSLGHGAEETREGGGATR